MIVRCALRDTSNESQYRLRNDLLASVRCRTLNLIGVIVACRVKETIIVRAVGGGCQDGSRLSCFEVSLFVVLELVSEL